MLLKRKNIPHRIQKKKNKVTLGIHALTKTDETKSNQTEPYPSTLSSLTKKKGVHTPSVSFFVKVKGGGNQSQLNSFCSSHIPLKYVYIHIHCIHTYILKTLSPFITKFHFPYTSILFIHPYHITKPFTIYHKKKRRNCNL
jgi:hypothetical protein